MKKIKNPDTIFWNDLHNFKFGSAEKIMIRKVSENEIDIMHISQMLERKKAILVNLQLMVKESGMKRKEIDDIEIESEMAERYNMEGTVKIGNKLYPKQVRLMNYFRGENAWYSNGKASLFRQVPGTWKKEDVYNRKYYTVSKLFSEKIPSAGPALRKAAEIYGKESCSELLSHHYGCPSDWQEFTSNFDEALFYACCVYEDRHWRPLNKKEIETDHKYGLIYSAIAGNPGFYKKRGNRKNTGLMIPAGEIPFLRCHPQYSYAMKMKPEDDLREDDRFECILFEHTEALCRAVYRRMGNGELIFRKHVRDLEKIQEMYINS